MTLLRRHRTDHVDHILFGTSLVRKGGDACNRKSLIGKLHAMSKRSPWKFDESCEDRFSGPSDKRKGEEESLCRGD